MFNLAVEWRHSLFKNNLISVLPCFTCIPKIGLGLPETGAIFTFTVLTLSIFYILIVFRRFLRRYCKLWTDIEITFRRVSTNMETFSWVLSCNHHVYLSLILWNSFVQSKLGIHPGFSPQVFVRTVQLSFSVHLAISEQHHNNLKTNMHWTERPTQVPLQMYLHSFTVQPHSSLPLPALHFNQSWLHHRVCPSPPPFQLIRVTSQIWNSAYGKNHCSGRCKMPVPFHR